MSEPTSQLTVACVLVTHLPVKAERRRYPALRGKPLVIIESCGSRDLVLDSSAEARGVTAGAPLTEALARCRDAVVMQADRTYYSDAFDRLTESLAMRCPMVEPAEMGCVYASLEGLGPVYGGAARLVASLLQAPPPEYNPQVGVAAGKFPAYVAAMTAGSGRAARAPHDAAAFLSGCSIDLLPLCSERKARLRRFGIHTLGHLAAMPVSSAQARLGAEGRRSWELARGIDHRPLRPICQAAA